MTRWGLVLADSTMECFHLILVKTIKGINGLIVYSKEAMWIINSKEAMWIIIIYSYIFVIRCTTTMSTVFVVTSASRFDAIRVQ